MLLTPYTNGYKIIHTLYNLSLKCHFLTAGEPLKKHLIHSFKKNLSQFSSVPKTCKPGVSNYLVDLVMHGIVEWQCKYPPHAVFGHHYSSTQNYCRKMISHIHNSK